MLNIFASKTVYGDKFAEKSRRKFNDQEKTQVKNAVVVEGEFGPSACFFLKTGGQVYIKMSVNSKLGVGENINLDDVDIVTIGRAGSADIDTIE